MGNFNKFDNSIFYVLAAEAAVVFIGGAIYLYSYQSIGNHGLAILVAVVFTLLLGAAVWHLFSILWDIEPRKKKAQTQAVAELAHSTPEDTPNLPEGFPDALATKQVLAFMQLFKSQGVLDENYKPYGNYSKTQLVYLIDAMNDIVPISKRWALFGRYWNIDGKLADISSDLRNNGTKVTDQNTLDKIIVRIDEYIPSIKYVNTFINWKKSHGFTDLK